MYRLDQDLGVKDLTDNHNKQGLQYCKENATINFL